MQAFGDEDDLMSELFGGAGAAGVPALAVAPTGSSSASSGTCGSSGNDSLAPVEDGHHHHPVIPESVQGLVGCDRGGDSSAAADDDDCSSDDLYDDRPPTRHFRADPPAVSTAMRVVAALKDIALQLLQPCSNAVQAALSPRQAVRVVHWPCQCVQ